MTAVSSLSTERRPYEPPTITVLGTIADLTLGDTPGAGDLDTGMTGDGGTLS